MAYLSKMKTLIVEIDSDSKAKELTSILSEMKFVKRVSAVKNPKDIIAALEEHERTKAAITKRKNRAIAKYL